MNHLLVLTAWEKSVFWHGWVSIVIVGLIFLLIGFLVGWLAWRRCRVQADQIEQSNDDLRERIQEVRRG